ncbi:hypothetical protein MUN46_004785 [Mesosutterella sp. AGMB02718]|uniref:Uncharacterized protein n=1 Tax=Mesosutterella faecium TaxID=2925194 RepID=A0ABT7ILK6_9BURK|nr:hypothetical protein [Mesosutterella sp. AGMB02718]MDL2059248.1 hypothetical protein [Mesosutterella sp. AGMB02718]
MPRKPAKPKNPNWGGARKGAGRKKIGEGVQRIVLFLAPSRIEKLKALGGRDWLNGAIDAAPLPDASTAPERPAKQD